MSRRLLTKLAAAGALAAVVGAGALSPTLVAAADESDMQNAIRFRDSFGLRSGRAFVEASFRDRDRFSDSQYGVPLTNGEASDLDARQQMVKSTQSALDYARAQPEYAGMFFDQADGGRPVFRFAAKRAQHTAAVDNRLPNTTGSRVTTAVFTLDQLEKKYTRILEERKELQQIMPMVSVDIDVVTNKVIVGLERTTPGAQKELQRRYGEPVIVEVLGRVESDVCKNRNDCGGTSGGTKEPWKGGIKIFLQNITSNYCTSGIMARRGSNLVMLTAAHCLVNNPADYGENWKHHTGSPRKIGNAINGTIEDGSNDGCLCHGDVGWIDVDTLAGKKPHDLFYANSNTAIRNVSSVPGDNSSLQQVGAIICRNGATSKYVCGKIDRLFASRIGSNSVDGHDVDKLRRTDFDASGGDSGGVMFWGTNFMGMHADSLTGVDPPQNGHSWYTTGGRVKSVGNDVCRTSSC